MFFYAGQYRNITEDDGTGVASSHLTLALTRGDLGAKLECRASSPVVETPMRAWVELDVYGKFKLCFFQPLIFLHYANNEHFCFKT